MSSAPINSGGPLGSVSYPGGQSGQTLIEMVGTAEVTSTLTGLYLRVTAGASATARAATSTPATTIRARLSATTSGEASTVAGVRSKVPLDLGVQPAEAVTSATPVLRRRISASGTATAVGAVTANTGRLAATTVASAIGTATTDAKIAAAASTLASAIPAAAAARLRLLSGASTVCAAVVPPAGSRQRMFTPAQVSAGAAGQASTRVRIRFSAATVAQAVCQSAAADYAATAAAPAERLMLVPPSDRRMEVVL